MFSGCFKDGQSPAMVNARVWKLKVHPERKRQHDALDTVLQFHEVWHRVNHRVEHRVNHRVGHRVKHLPHTIFAMHGAQVVNRQVDQARVFQKLPPLRLLQHGNA